MDLTKALDFLEKQGLDDCHYQDSGMMEHIAENMQKYADQQLILSGVVSSKTLRSRIANNRERLKRDLDNTTNIINGNKGMSSDYIIDKARNMPFLRCKLNLIDELLDD